jgi:hypothetical protein
MKHKPLSLAVVDLRDGLGPELVGLFQKLASKPPRTRCADVNGVRNAIVLHDWRKVGQRYLRRFARRINPNIWVYRGGGHLAVHVHRPPNADGRIPCSTFADQDPCLCRIVET